MVCYATHPITFAVVLSGYLSEVCVDCLDDPIVNIRAPVLGAEDHVDEGE